MNRVAMHSKLEVHPCHPTIGAEIYGIDLCQPLCAAERDLIRSLLIKHKVIFFRDQDFTEKSLLQFASQFGAPEVTPFLNEGSKIVKIDNDAEHPPVGTNCWHTDWSATEKPTMAIVLHAVEVPEVGGDTLFADMVAAYKGLPNDIKKRIDGLVAVHDEKSFPEDIYNVEWSDVKRAMPLQTHPIVRTHPESGEKILYVNEMLTKAIPDIGAEQSRDLLQYLCAQARVPEYQVRFKWRKNSVAFWDNRSTQHYASADYTPAVRRLRRVALAGDKPY